MVAIALPAMAQDAQPHWHWTHHHHRHHQSARQEQNGGTSSVADATPATPDLWTPVTGSDGNTYDLLVLDPPGSASPTVLLDNPATGQISSFQPVNLTPPASLPVAPRPAKASSAVTQQSAAMAPQQASVAAQVPAQGAPPQQSASQPPDAAATEPADQPITAQDLAALAPAPAATPDQVNRNSLCGTFSIESGQIVGPDGKSFVGKGINIYADQFISNGPDAITSAFPGVNFVRLNVFDLANDTPDKLLPQILKLNSEGVVVEIEDHNYPSVLTGSDLANAASWYQQWAAATLGDPNVVFGTQNEPNLSQGVGAVNNEIHTIYAAIRGTGNNALVLVNPSGGFSTGGIETAGMSNVAWDLHFYNWESNNSTDLGVNQQSLASLVSGAKSTANIPAFIGEYGNASGANGSVYDPGGMQVVQAVQQSGLSSAAWAWTSGDSSYPLLLSDGNGNPRQGLTQFGQMTAQYIAGASHASCKQQPTTTASMTPISNLGPALNMGETQ